MANNNFWIDLIANLHKAKSKAQIKNDLKSLGDFKIPLIGSLSKSKTRAQIKKDLANMNNVGTVNLNTKVNSNGVAKAVQQTTSQAQKKASQQPIKLSFSIKKDKLVNDIKLLSQQNSKLFNNKDMTSKYNALLDGAKLATSSKELNYLRLQLSAFRSELRVTGHAGLTMGDTLKKGLKKAMELFGSYGMIMAFTQQLKNAWTEALTLDKTFTDLAKVQDDLSRSDYPEYLDKCNEKAEKLATTQKELIKSATEFAKSGYTSVESDELSERAIKLSNVGDMTASDSAKAIISGVQAYDVIDDYDDVLNKADALIDKYNEIGNIASISTEEIAKGVQSVGSVFSDSNTSVDEFIALLAAGNRQFQDADSLALGLRTSALRIRGCTAELEAMGEETDSVVTSSSRLAEKIEGLTNIDGSGGVKILEGDEQTFRSIYDIYLDISKVYSTMSDIDQSALLDLIAGKHRASGISATLNNMSEAQEIYQNSLNATGSAQEEYEKYLESSDASLNKFKSSMTATYQSLIDGETTKGILDVGNATLQFANSIGLVESTLKGFITIGILKVVTTLSAAFKASAIQASNFSRALNTTKNLCNLTKGTIQYGDALRTLKRVSGGLSDVQLKQVLSSNNLTQSQRVQILQTTGLTKAQAKAKLSQMGLTQTTNAQTVANGVATTSTFSLSAAVKGFGLSLKAAFLSNPVGISIMALSTIIGAVSSKVSEYNQKMEETRQKNIESGKKVAEQVKNLSDVYAQYEKLASIQRRTTSQEEEFKTAVENITSALGTKAEVLHGLVAGTDEYTQALKNATAAELENQYTTSVKARKSAEEDLEKDTYSNWDGSQITIQLNEQMIGVEEHMKSLEVIRNQLSAFEDEGTYGLEWEPVNFDKDKDNMENIIEYYNALKEAQNTLILETQSTGDDSLLDSDIYKDIDSTISSLTESVENYQTARYNELKLEYMWQNGVPTTIDDYNAMEKVIINNSNAGETFQETLKGMLSQDFSNLKTGISETSDAMEDLENKANQAPLSFTDTVSQVQSLSEGLDQLDKIYADVTNKEAFDWSSILNNENFEKSFGTLGSVYDDFIQTVSNSPNDINACQDAFNNLTTSYINNSDILNNLTEETKASTIAMLEQLGVANATELVESSLALQKQFLAVTGTELVNATYEEINAFLAESEAADDAKQALAVYQLQKELAAGLTLDTSGDIQNLENLVTACGGAAKALSALNKLKNGDTSQFMYGGKDNYNALVDLAEKEVQDAIREVQNSSSNASNKVVYGGGSDTKKAVDSAKKASESAKETVETFNWIETAISRFQRTITNLGKTVSASYLSWSKRNTAVTSELSAITKEISLQQSAYQKYTDMANGSGLSDTYKSLVQNGGLSIEDIADDTLKEQIKTYQDYYEKALSASDAVQDLKENLAGLAKTRFDNLTAQYDAKTGDIDHSANLINGQMGKLESRNKIAGKSFYEALIAQENQKLDSLSSEYEEKMQSINDAVSSGMVEYGSEDWYDMKSDIDGVTESIQEAQNNVIDFENSLKQVAKLDFDNLSEQFGDAIGLVTDASDVFSGHIDQAEASGAIAGTSFYKGLLEAKNTEAGALKQKYDTLSSTFTKAIQDGSIKEFSSEWYEMKSSISETESAIVSADTAVIELTNSLKEVAKLKFDNIASQFDNAAGLIANKIDAVNKYVSMTEESGYMASADYYGTLIDAEKGRIDALSKEYGKLSDGLASAFADGSVEEYDDNWYEMMESIHGVESSLIDANTALIQYANSMRQVQWDIFDRMQDSVSGLVDESNFLVDLMSKNNKLYDDYGNMNERGLSVQGLHTVNYELYLKQAQEYADEMKNINSQLAADPKNTTLIDRYKELLSLQHDSILNAEDEKTAIKDLISDGYDLMLSSIDELINKRKDALRAEKDLYDYEKKVSEQADAVASYEKQLQAYAGDDSEEMKATIQKLQTNLISAQEELSETEYEKYISDQEAMLDTFYSQMEEWVNARLDDINGLLSQAIDATNANAATISGQINMDVNNVGATLSQNMHEVWSGANSGNVVSRLNTDFNDRMSSVNAVVEGIRTYNSSMTVTLQQSKTVLDSTYSVLDAVKTKTESIEPRVTEISQSTQTMVGGINSVKSAIDLVKSALDGIKTAVEEIEPTTVVNNYTTGSSGGSSSGDSSSSSSGGEQTSQTNNGGNNGSSSSTGKAPSTNKGSSSTNKNKNESASTNKNGLGQIGSVSQGSHNTLHKYGTGTGNAASGYHIVGDEGDEIILDNDGNALVAKGEQLHHFEGGETVLNDKETEKVLNGRDDLILLDDYLKIKGFKMPEFEMPYYSAPAQPVAAPKQTSPNVTNDINVELSFPGVKNYEEMVTKMQTDRRFESIVQEMTLGQAMGKNSYNKLKY